jgi:hypothetical protein
MIKIDFEIIGEHGNLRDCIILPIDHNMSDAEIELMKQKRYSDWVALITPLDEG